MDSNILDQVLSHLKTDAGLTNAFVEHFLGCIVVPCGEYELWFGTANETWGADVNLNGEPTDKSIDTDLSSDCAIPSLIALSITEAAMKFELGR